MTVATNTPKILRATTIDGFCAACGTAILVSFGKHLAFDVPRRIRISQYGTSRYRVHLHPGCDTQEVRSRIEADAASWTRWRPRGGS